MKKCWIQFIAAIILLASAAAPLSGEPTVVLTKEHQCGLIKVFHESSSFIPPPMELRTWTNADGSVARMIPSNDGSKTNAFHVVVESSGKKQTNGTIFRPPGNFQKDAFYVAIESGGKITTNRDLQMSEVHATLEPEIKIVDVLYEPSTVVYLYERHSIATVSNQSSLGVMVVTSASGMNASPMMTGRPLWHPLWGSPSELRNVKMSGSVEKGTLAITLDSITGKYSTAQTNRYQNGKWIVSMGQPQSTAIENSH